MPKPVLQVSNLNYSAGNFCLKDISFELFNQDALIILGMSGSGKSTLAKICCGLYPPTSGQILVKGKNINDIPHKELYRHIGLLFQDAALLSNLNVFDNIALPARYHGKLEGVDIKENEIKARVSKLIESFNLQRIAKQNPSSLSLGQKILVSFLRLFLIKPEIIIFDEPTASLDVEYTNILIEMIREYIILGGSVIGITHDMFYANALANKMAILDDGEIIALGRPIEIKSHPNERVTKIVKSVSQDADLADELLKLMA